MVILEQYTKYAYGVLGLLGILAIIFSALFLFISIDFFYTCGIKTIGGWILVLIGATMVTLGVIGIVCDHRPFYKVYLTGMSFNEFVKDYEITDVDGLIITAYKKGEK